MLVNFLMGVMFILCGRDEQAYFTWGDIWFSTVTSVKFAGRKKLEIVSLLDKTVPISVTTPYRRDNTDAMDAVECINDNSTCVVHWVQYYWSLYPAEQDQFYCYPASAKMLKVSYYICFNYFCLLIFFYLSQEY